MKDTIDIMNEISDEKDTTNLRLGFNGLEQYKVKVLNKTKIGYIVASKDTMVDSNKYGDVVYKNISDFNERKNPYIEFEKNNKKYYKKLIVDYNKIGNILEINTKPDIDSTKILDIDTKPSSDINYIMIERDENDMKYNGVFFSSTTYY